eukprot:6199324-Pleurochrysis_carterae.AAC.1
MVFLIGECKLEKQGKIAKAAGSSSAVDLDGASAFAHPPGDGASAQHRKSLTVLMEEKYGSALAQTLLLMLMVYDAYRVWRETLDLPAALHDKEAKTDAALQMAVAGAVTAS